jgi:activating signal cointegrator complex subunit 1
MNPKLTIVGNSCYRRLDIPNDGVIHNYNTSVNTSAELTPRAPKQSVDVSTREPSLPSIDVLEVMDEAVDEDVDDISEVNSTFRLVLKTPKMFHCFVMGERGHTKRDIEDQTRTRITIPRREESSCDVVITGNDRYDVRTARKEVEKLVAFGRQHSDITHFVSIPMNESSVVNQFQAFKAEILADNHSKHKGVVESLFQKSGKLHVTLVPLLLCDEKEISSASQILDECLDTIQSKASGQTVRVRLQGIGYMNDDPTQVHVLYAKVVDLTDNQCLQSIVDHIFDAFKDSGLVKGSQDLGKVSADTKVKLHCTLLNSRYRTDESVDRNRDNRRNRKKRMPFDASHILKQYGDYVFGEVDVKDIEISIIGSYKGRNGYYSHTSRIEL